MKKTAVTVGVTLAIVLGIGMLANRDNSERGPENNATPTYTSDKIFEGVESIHIKQNIPSLQYSYILTDNKGAKYKAEYNVGGIMRIFKEEGDSISLGTGMFIKTTVYNNDDEITGYMESGQSLRNDYKYYDYRGVPLGRTKTKLRGVYSTKYILDNDENELYELHQKANIAFHEYDLKVTDSTKIPIEFAIYTVIKGAVASD